MPINMFPREELPKPSAGPIQRAKAIVHFVAGKLVTPIDGGIERRPTRFVSVLALLATEEQQMIFVQVGQPSDVFHEGSVSLHLIRRGSSHAVTFCVSFEFRCQDWCDLSQVFRA